MARDLKKLATFLIIAMALGCEAKSQTTTDSQKEDVKNFKNSGGAVKTEMSRIREPAVAGLFYPKSPSALTEMIDKYLKEAPDFKISDLRGLVCPHAGYIYSGPVAAYGYKQLIGKKYKTVILLAPSHYALFRGASVCSAALYRTPLGDVKISPKALQISQKPPFIPESPARVQRPGWSMESSRGAPEYGKDTPHTWEHSDEVQVPFLQRVLKEFELIPIIVGDCDSEQAAKVLNEFVDNETLIVASSDLSHYLPYDSARTTDNRCVKTICELDLKSIEMQEACGRIPIAILMHIAVMRGWKPQLLNYRNSGDTAGDKRAVVGYASIAFVGNAKDNGQKQTANSVSSQEKQQATLSKDEKPDNAGSLSKEQKKFLLDLARQAVKAAATKQPLPVVDEKQLDNILKEKRACFVTLTKDGNLRGCIGHISPVEPLYKAVIENAEAAAIYDTRFEPVRADEIKQIEIEISILTEPKPLEYNSVADLLSKLRAGIDGVVLNVMGRRSTFLPQVWEQLPDKVEFLNHLSLKAGAPADAWRRPDTKVFTYQVEKFKESDF
ncbi:MAG: AmmeMemoRadiSam system protein B [Verrucomicrobiia bacterium]